jgi:hypothetical protein
MADQDPAPTGGTPNGGTGDTGAPPAAQTGGTGDTGGQPAAGDTPAWKTLGIPAHMLKETPEQTLGEVFKGYKGFLDKQAASGPVGKSPDDYKFEFAAELKPYFPTADDPALKNFQAWAHKSGMAVKQANELINEVFAPLAKEGKLGPVFNPQAEIDKVAALLGKTGPDAAAAIEQATGELEAWSKNLGQQIKLTQEEQVELESLLMTGSGFGLMRKLQAAAGGDAFKVGGSQPGKLSRADLEAMRQDPRWSTNSTKYDAAFRQRYEEAWRALPPDDLK